MNRRDCFRALAALAAGAPIAAEAVVKAKPKHVTGCVIASGPSGQATYVIAAAGPEIWTIPPPPHGHQVFLCKNDGKFEWVKAETCGGVLRSKKDYPFVTPAIARDNLRLT